MNFINNTPLNAEPFILSNATGAETVLVVVKGTWAIGKDGNISVSDNQVPIQLSPIYHGDPVLSSLRYDTDLTLAKPGTDCVLIGHAWAPYTGVPHVDVTFAVGPVYQRARVFGDRKWLKHAVRGASISTVQPFEKIPLRWENAFGGKDTSCQNPADHAFCLENPVGRGMMSGKSNLNMDSLLLPNIENPADLIQKPGQRPRPWGFGIIAPHWQPRIGYAGTYDQNWRTNLCPLPPPDLDPRFYSSAAPGLCTLKHLTGTEPVVVEGATKERAPLRLELPDVKPQASVRCRQKEEVIHLQLDTVIVEPDDARLVLVWRGALNVHGKTQEIGRVRVQL